MRKIAILTGSAMMLVSSVLPAMADTTAAGNTCTNSTTGPMSLNSCTIKNTSTVTVNNVNDAIVNNNVTSSSNTGGNEASMNTLGGSVVTGNAALSSNVSTVANVNTTKITGGAAASGNVGGNEITGPQSTNLVFIENQHKTAVDNSNTARVTNNVSSSADTGNNRANLNTGPATVTTGNSQLGVTVGTHVNDSLTEIMAGAGGTGGNQAYNSTTGPLAINSVTIINRNRTSVDNVNDMLVTNNVNASSNSGGNEAKTNTLGGTITTGSAKAGVGVDTEGNINTTKLTLSMGGFGNYGENSVTGPGFGASQYDPLIWIENNQDVVVENWNNKCRSHNADTIDGGLDECDVRDLGVTNSVNAVSDTGRNLSNVNTGGGDVLAGMSELLQNVLVHMNDSFTTIQQ